MFLLTDNFCSAPIVKNRCPSLAIMDFAVIKENDRVQCVTGSSVKKDDYELKYVI